MSGARADTAAGLAVIAVVCALLTINLGWILRNAGELRPVVGGHEAPRFVLPRAGGGEERLAAQRGQVVLLSFWASWCAACLRELPLLAGLQRRHAGRGLLVWGINVEGELAKVQRVRQAHLAARELTMLLDREGEVARRYAVQTLPHLVVVGRDGRVTRVHVGAGRVSRLEAAVEQALSQAAWLPDRSPPSR